MKNLLLIFTLLFFLTSCNDREKSTKKSSSSQKEMKSFKKVENWQTNGLIYDGGNAKVYGDSTIDKTKITYTSAKFEPYISFKDFKVPIENVKAKLDLSSNELGHIYTTRIRKDYDDEKSIFAGHYTLASWGCGAPCQASVIIDRRTGKIYDSPTSGMGYKFQKDSRMLIVNPPDSLGFYENCVYCKPQIFILNEKTKKFEQRQP